MFVEAYDVTGKSRVKADIECVALVVVHRRIVEALITCRRSDGSTDESAGDVAALFGDLVGIGKMGLPKAPDSWRTKRQLPGLDESSVNRDGIIDARIPDIRVVEEVVYPILKSIGIEKPAFIGYLHAKLILFVALAVKRNEGCVVCVGIVDHRA